MECEDGGERFGDIDAALGRHRLDSRGAADMCSEKILLFDDRVLPTVDGPEMPANA